MSTQPIRLEARLSAQERRQINLDARIRGTSRDMTASFKQLSEYLGHMDARIDKIEGNIARIEATMATKQDLAAMENRLLNAFKQLLATVNQQRPLSQ